MPKHPLPKSMGSIHLMAHIIISKYADGLPLYRMEGILSRYGGDITRATMANWAIKLAHQFQPLINLMREHQLSGDIIQMDETVLKVLKEPGLSAHSNKYMWVSRGGPPGQPSVLFEYDPSRKKEVPLRLLDGFSGYLQTEHFSGQFSKYFLAVSSDFCHFVFPIILVSHVNFKQMKRKGFALWNDRAVPFTQGIFTTVMILLQYLHGTG
ncbi:IS66 family transposase [sulfur-oxidizing endosymbiont of Gigantopelta aegis]|uniref:IS66 family transposase n=1 Tax=sulfur-oxidizing endosymbiont of Gigantopelta aegis TaxID=2794934 RepID=UPI0018DC0A5D|nr:transposase [sulfur-oxidizing endosymbiont of Gigantopelta aegis]